VLVAGDERRANTRANEARKTPEQRAQEARDLDLQARASIGVVALRDGMKDPESFVLRRFMVTSNGTGCVDYRAKNSFGATFPGSAVVTSAGKVLVQERHGRQFTTAWNGDCAGKTGRDLTEFAQTRLLK